MPKLFFLASIAFLASTHSYAAQFQGTASQFSLTIDDAAGCRYESAPITLTFNGHQIYKTAQGNCEYRSTINEINARLYQASLEGSQVRFETFNGVSTGVPTVLNGLQVVTTLEAPVVQQLNDRIQALEARVRALENSSQH